MVEERKKKTGEGRVEKFEKRPFFSLLFSDFFPFVFFFCSTMQNN